MSPLIGVHNFYWELLSKDSQCPLAASAPQSAGRLRARAPRQPVLAQERQRLQLCALHTLNNLFQGEAFTRCDLARLADGLTRRRARVLSPHHWPLVGNYDVNVLAAAFASRGKELVWVKQGTAPDLRAAWALVLSLPAQGRLAAWLGGRHWLGLRRLGPAGVWHNLDSLLPRPQPLPAPPARGGPDAADEAARQFLLRLQRERPRALAFLVRDAFSQGGAEASGQG